MEEDNTIDVIHETFQETKDLIFYLKNNNLSIEVETDTREKLIERVKFLLTQEILDPAEKRIVQIILTKLYTWNPFLADFQGVGDLPVLIDQIISTLDILMETEEISVLNIKYYKDDGDEQIAENSPINIDLELALEEIEKLPTIEGYSGSILGFINDSKDNIYFIRQETDMWMIDLPFSEDDEYSHMLSDDTLSTRAVKEIVSIFFTEKDVMKELRKKLVLTEIIKQILNLERDLGRQASIDDITRSIGVSSEDATMYMDLIDNSTDYEEREVAMLKKKARYVFKKLPDPNLYELIVNLGMDFFTAKKVGKYLIDLGWLGVFPRTPIA